MNRNPAKADLYRVQNLEAARIIAADLECYRGVMQEWAAMVLAKAEGTEPAAGRAA